MMHVYSGQWTPFLFTVSAVYKGTIYTINNSVEK
jgi:hypothetical protein